MSHQVAWILVYIVEFYFAPGYYWKIVIYRLHVPLMVGYPENITTLYKSFYKILHIDVKSNIFHCQYVLDDVMNFIINYCCTAGVKQSLVNTKSFRTTNIQNTI